MSKIKIHPAFLAIIIISFLLNVIIIYGQNEGIFSLHPPDFAADDNGNIYLAMPNRIVKIVDGQEAGNVYKQNNLAAFRFTVINGDQIVVGRQEETLYIDLKTNLMRVEKKNYFGNTAYFARSEFTTNKGEKYYYSKGIPYYIYPYFWKKKGCFPCAYWSCSSTGAKDYFHFYHFYFHSFRKTFWTFKFSWAKNTITIIQKLIRNIFDFIIIL